MADSIDITQQRIDIEAALAAKERETRRQPASPFCVECGDDMPERYALGYRTCIHCQTAIERHASQHARVMG